VISTQRIPGIMPTHIELIQPEIIIIAPGTSH
jgi:hypothetical protein